jgi:hypothetical protein
MQLTSIRRIWLAPKAAPRLMPRWIRARSREMGTALRPQVEGGQRGQQGEGLAQRRDARREEPVGPAGSAAPPRPTPPRPAQPHLNPPTQQLLHLVQTRAKAKRAS